MVHQWSDLSSVQKGKGASLGPPLVLPSHAFEYGSFFVEPTSVSGDSRLAVDRIDVAKLTEIKAIQVHHLVPRPNKVPQELLLGVGTGIDFCDSAQLGMRAEDQVDAGASPLNLVCLTVAPLVNAFRTGGRLPFRAHVEQVDKEVVRERSGMLGEDAMCGLAGVCAEDAQATDENGHFRSRQLQ